MTTTDLEANNSRLTDDAIACGSPSLTTTPLTSASLTTDTTNSQPEEEPQHHHPVEATETGTPTSCSCSADDLQQQRQQRQQLESDEQTAADMARRDWHAKQTVSSNSRHQSKPDALQTITLVPGESPADTFDKNMAAVAWNSHTHTNHPARSAKDIAKNSTYSGSSLLGAVSVMGDVSNHSQEAPSILHLRPVHPDNYNSVNHNNNSSSNARINNNDTEVSQDDVEQHQQQPIIEEDSTDDGPTQTNSNNNDNNNNGEVLLEATLVEDHHHHETSNHDPSQRQDDGHHNPMLPSTEAHVVGEAEKLHCGGFSRRQLKCLSLGGCGLLVLIVVAVAISLVLSDDGSTNDGMNNFVSEEAITFAPTPTPRPTLDIIRNRGFLKCGIWSESVDFFQLVNTYETKEDQVDFVLCRAYAAAIFDGDASKHEIVLTTSQESLRGLNNGKFDMLLSHVNTGMQADIWESELDVNAGFTFSVPYVYTDLVYGGLPQYVACADDNMNARGNCSGIRICTNDNTAYFEALSGKLPERYMIKRNDTLDIVLGFVSGECNVIPSENSGIMEWSLELLGYQGDYVRGTLAFQKDVVSVATRDDDDKFSDFVNIILMGIFAAEQAGVTKETANKMASVGVLGDNLVHAVRAVGSYKDVYEQGVTPFMKRSRWNMINNGTTGLLYTLQLGRVRQRGPGRRDGGTLAKIWDRRKLHCGIRTDGEGFASLDSNGNLAGLDVEFCMALAASALEGEAQNIEFISILNEADGYQKLQAGEVDVLAGFTWNVVNDYQEPTTGQGYSFSQPYFYRPIADEWQTANATNNVISLEEENRCLVSRQDDPQFSSFVFWVVAAIIYAAEQGITQIMASEKMPDINLFGDDYLKMFRDAVFFSGNYDEVYERHLGALLPERGRNAVNNIKAPGPQIYVPPGYF